MTESFNSIFDDQADFMIAAEQTTDEFNPSQTELYLSLVVEEFQEVVAAESVEGLVKELCDLIVVCAGALHSIGVDPQSAWDEVHRANMSKCSIDYLYNEDGTRVTDENGTPLAGFAVLRKREDGKVLKPETYVPANIRPLIEHLFDDGASAQSSEGDAA